MANLSQLPPPPSGQKGMTLDQLGVPPAGQKGQTLEQILAQQSQQPDKSVGFAGTKFLGENVGLLSEAKPLMQTSKTGTALQNIINQRVASGKTTQARANQLSQGLQPDINQVAPTHTTGELIRGGVKAGLDIGSLVIGGAGAEGLATKTLGGLVKQGAIQGAKYGATGGAMQGLGQGIEENQGVGNTIEQTVKGGAIGGVTGGITGGVLPIAFNAKSIAGEAKNAISSKLSNMIKGKSIEDILKVPESEVYKLNPTERSAWFQNAQEQLTNKHEKIAQNITKDLQNKAIASQTEAEALQKELATATRDKTIELRPKIQQAMGRQSATYRRIVSEELTPHAQVPVKTTDLNSFIDSKFADNPETANAIKLKLGTAEQVNTATGITSRLEGDVSKVKDTTTLGELYQRTQNLKQDISAGARKGTSTFTPADKLTDDAISTMTDYMKSQGVDLSKSRQFWAKYAPIRDQLVREAKPFLQSGTQTKTFAGTLSRVARGTDVNNENFIGEVEKLVGQPITKEARGIVAKMDTNTKTALSDKINAEAQRINNQMKQDQSLKRLSAKQFEIERRVRLREGIKRVLKYVVPGIVGEEVIRRF